MRASVLTSSTPNNRDEHRSETKAGRARNKARTRTTGRMVAVCEITHGHEPRAWLETLRERLGFKSQSAMHKAIAKSTGIKYDTVHKALTQPRPERRVRLEIKQCIEHWIERSAKGLRPDVDFSLLVVSPAATQQILRELRFCYVDQQTALAEAAQVSGSTRATLQKYLDGEEEKPFPADSYDALVQLLDRRRRMFQVLSYLSNDEKRAKVQRLNARLREFLARWRANPSRVAFRHRFRELRLQMIAEIKNEDDLPQESRV